MERSPLSSAIGRTGMEVRMSCSEKILAWIKFLSRNWKTLIRFEGAKLKGGGM